MDSLNIEVKHLKTFVFYKIAILPSLLYLQEAPYLSICDNTAPTSPASPEAADVEDMEFEGPLNPPVHPLKPSPRALFSPGLGRNIIPDRENPPQEILDWVSIFSRYNLIEHLVVVKRPNLRNLRRGSNMVGFT